MNLQTIMSAWPWVRRAWRLLPPQGRIVALVLVAVAGFAASWMGSRESAEVRAREQRTGTPAHQQRADTPS